MIARIHLILLFAIAGFQLQAITLSDSARISLLTCGPGEELYSAFGHTGIRVTDYKQDFDVVFNYGTFDFEQPGFYTNFVKGKMRYMLAVESYRGFLQQYMYEERKVTEQEILINPEQKKKVFELLEINSRPENREYYYDFFWDNCATRPRDIFERALGSVLTYDTVNGNFERNKTMHDMLRLFVHNRPWVDYGFDLILGLNCEIEATPRHQTFLPLYLSHYMDCAQLNGQPLTGKQKVVIDVPETYSTIHLFTPLLLNVLILLFAVLLTFFELKHNRHHAWFDIGFFFIAGLVGTIFLLLWIFSSHFSVPKNLNLLWLVPSHIVLAFFLLPKKKASWLGYYFTFTAFLSVLILLCWFVTPQPFNIAIIPLLVLIILRSWIIKRFSNQ